MDHCISYKITWLIFITQVPVIIFVSLLLDETNENNEIIQNLGLKEDFSWFISDFSF